jgi:hypothetical protein
MYRYLPSGYFFTYQYRYRLYFNAPCSHNPDPYLTITTGFVQDPDSNLNFGAGLHSSLSASSRTRIWRFSMLKAGFSSRCCSSLNMDGNEGSDLIIYFGFQFTISQTYRSYSGYLCFTLLLQVKQSKVKSRLQKSNYVSKK